MLEYLGLMLCLILMFIYVFVVWFFLKGSSWFQLNIYLRTEMVPQWTFPHSKSEMDPMKSHWHFKPKNGSQADPFAFQIRNGSQVDPGLHILLLWSPSTCCIFAFFTITVKPLFLLLLAPTFTHLHKGVQSIPIFNTFQFHLYNII